MLGYFSFLAQTGLPLSYLIVYNNIVKGKLSFMQQGWGNYTEETLIFGVLLIAATISNYLEQSGVI